MQNITIGRYSEAEGIEKAFAGWIEGVRDDGTSWIMYLDAEGNPETFWAQRESDGAVIGDAMILAP
jgi:hypothetical protein